MGFKKLTRVISVRKWWVIVAALLGAGIGYLLTSSLNEDRQPAFEAKAAIEFGTTDTERDRDVLVEDLGEALVAAETANQEVIAQGQGQVSSNEQTGQLLFSARAREEAVASQRADEMRTAYLESTAADSAEDRQQRLDEMVTEASELLVQLEALDPTEEPVLDPELDPEVAARLSVLNALVAGLTAQHTKLEVDLILAESGDEREGTPEEIQEELDAIALNLDEAYAEIAEITRENGLTPEQVTGRPEESAETTQVSDTSRTETVLPDAQTPEEVEEQWTIDALQSRYEELAAEYEALFMEQEGSTGELTAVEVTDLTPARASARLNTGLGLLLGAIVASALVVGESRVKGRVYVLSDAAPLAGLGEMPTVPGLTSSGPGWTVAPASPRRAQGVHQLRIALLGLMGSNTRTLAIGLTGVGVDHREMGMLATDLATRIAASGGSVLVLDVDFDTDSPYPVPPYPVPASSITVAGLISGARDDPEAGATRMKAAFSEASPTESFRLVRSGSLEEDPADVVLTDAFRVLLEIAREQSDIVLVVTPDASHHAIFSLQQRLDGLIAVCAVGKSRRNTLLGLADPGPGAGAPLGVVLFTRWSWWRRLLQRLNRGPRSTTPGRRTGKARLPWLRRSAESGAGPDA